MLKSCSATALLFTLTVTVLWPIATGFAQDNQQPTQAEPAVVNPPSDSADSDSPSTESPQSKAAKPTAADAKTDVLRGELLAAKAFRAAAARIRPSLLRVETFAQRSVSGKGPAAARGDSTAVFVRQSKDAKTGYAVTSSFALIDNPTAILLVLPTGERQLATLAREDKQRKLCLLKFSLPQGAKLQPPAVADAKLRVGQWTIAVGMGLGRQPAISAGILSATERIGGKALQTDANTSPINYGGPLLDIEGNILGICVPLHPKSKEAASGVAWYDSGIGFAIAWKDVLAMAKDAVEK